MSLSQETAGADF